MSKRDVVVLSCNTDDIWDILGFRDSVYTDLIFAVVGVSGHSFLGCVAYWSSL
jgi:hypothetical protein